MSHYRQIDVRIWNDAKFRSLDHMGKLAFLMMLTHPMMTAIGAMRGTPDGLAAEMDCRSEGMRDAFHHAFRDIIAKGMMEYDEEASLIALPNFVKYNPPQSVNVLKAWAKCLEFLPECALRTKSIQRAVGFLDGMSHAFRDAIPKVIIDAMGYPENREQRTESRDPRTKIKINTNHKGKQTRGTYPREMVSEDGEVFDPFSHEPETFQ